MYNLRLLGAYCIDQLVFFTHFSPDSISVLVKDTQISLSTTGVGGGFETGPECSLVDISTGSELVALGPTDVISEPQIHHGNIPNIEKMRHPRLSHKHLCCKNDRKMETAILNHQLSPYKNSGGRPTLRSKKRLPCESAMGASPSTRLQVSNK